MDFADLEEKIVANNVKLMLLCSPHNPVGRVWTRAELQKVGDICLKHGVITVSDEIHGDFVWGNNSQTVFASLGEQYEQNCVICTAPSKTFNIAGLQVSNIFIPNKNLRRRFRKQVAARLQPGKHLRPCCLSGSLHLWRGLAAAGEGLYRR